MLIPLILSWFYDSVCFDAEVAFWITFQAVVFMCISIVFLSNMGSDAVRTMQIIAKKMFKFEAPQDISKQCTYLVIFSQAKHTYFTVYYIIFRSSIWNWLLYRETLFFSHVDNHSPSPINLKSCPLSGASSWHFSGRSMSYECLGLLLGSLFWPTDLCLILCQHLTILVTSALQCILKSGGIMPSAL